MSIKVGDKIAVKYDTTKGIVTKITGNNICIETIDGFDLVFLKEELVVYQSDLDNLTKVKNKDLTDKSNSLKRKHSPLKSTVDLHCQSALYFKSILERQLHIFRTELNRGQRIRVPEMTFIHGVGQGILRQNIEKILTQKGIDYSDAPYNTFGEGGAIRVYFK